MKVIVVYTNCMMDNLIPVGASVLIGVLKDINCEIKLFDTTFYKTEEISSDEDRSQNLQVIPVDLKKYGVVQKENNYIKDFRLIVKSFNPDFIMISVVENTWDQAVYLLEAIKDIKPYVICGGIFAILSPQEIIKNENVDAVCIGECEDAIRELCMNFNEGKPSHYDISNIWFKKGDKIIYNSITSLVDLDNAPYMDFSFYEKPRFLKPMQGRVWKMVPIEFSRGCPYKCTYCANHAIARNFKQAGQWYRWKSLDRIFNEIDFYLNNYEIEFFYFVSETFLTISGKKFQRFYERYKKYKIPFWFNTRPESITKKKIEMLEEIGCYRIGIGLEHGNPAFREKMLNRKCSNDQIIEACHIVENSKISYSINNIIGFPGETRELIFDTVNLNKKINPDTIGVFVFTPFRGTDLYDYCIQNGYIDQYQKVGDLNRTTILKNNVLSEEELKGLLRTFPLYVHFSKEYFPRIREAEKFTDEGNKTYKELSNIFKKDHLY